MSYIRASGPYEYVDNDECIDYVFPTAQPKVKNPRDYNKHPEDYEEYIEDYGSITNNGMIELLIKNWNTTDEQFKKHLVKRLAEKLNVKLRKNKLTSKQYAKISHEQMRIWEKQQQNLKNVAEHEN